MFEDRKDAGERLAKALKKYKDRKVLVLGIPRGGVEVAYHVATYLGAEFSMLVARKLPYPYNPEAGFGAITEDNSIFMFKNAERELSKKEIEKIIEEQKQEVKRRVERLRKGKPLPEISGREVILIDDGLAMGSTMRTAIMLCKNRKAERIVVAVPVSGRDIARDIGEMVDEIVVLEKPLFFYAVAQVYNNWYDVSDEEVLEIMKKAEEILK